MFTGTESNYKGAIELHLVADQFWRKAFHCTQELAIRIGCTRAAEQLGVSVANVQRWKSNLENKEPSSKKEKESLEEINRRLQKKNDELKKANYILKRAAAFFSQDHLK